MTHPNQSHEIAVVTNIPAPYRDHLFEVMHAQCTGAGDSFTVYYLARTEEGRSWDYANAQFSYPMRFAAGIHFAIKGQVFHFNPFLPLALMINAPRVLVLGGGWPLPTILAIIMMKPFFRSTYMILWSEANMYSSRGINRLVFRFRKWIYERVDALLIPGTVAHDTIVKEWGVVPKTIHYLPNTVDPRKYGEGVAALRINREQYKNESGFGACGRIFLIPARLEEKTKGIINFLRAIEGVEGGTYTIIIAGEGTDRTEIAGYVRGHHSPVLLLGHQTEEEMLKLYAIADVFVLPSFIDRNPLSVIEALWARLPLLISNRCGNWPEAVTAGKNGWIIDPDDHATIQYAMSEALSLPQETLNEYGIVSYVNAQQFDTETVVDRFMKDCARV
jgi:glycosyltransferase involved in cell wall biosynthesis